MKLIAEIYESHLGIDNSHLDTKYKVRKASRAVILNDQMQMALLYVEKNNYHKLPGGGFEQGEDRYTALDREVAEEVGVVINTKDDFGIIIEYRDQIEQLQISYCCIAEVRNSLEGTCFTEQEKAMGFQLKWLDILEAFHTIHNDKPKDYVGKFIQRRDFLFLSKAILLMSENLNEEQKKLFFEQVAKYKQEDYS